MLLGKRLQFMQARLMAAVLTSRSERDSSGRTASAPMVRVAVLERIARRDAAEGGEAARPNPPL